MKRRQLLVILGTAPIAGCVGGDGGRKNPVGRIADELDISKDEATREQIDPVLDNYELEKTTENRQEVARVTLTEAGASSWADAGDVLRCIQSPWDNRNADETPGLTEGAEGMTKLKEDAAWCAE